MDGNVEKSKFKVSREEVYGVIDGERAYQELRWSPATTPTGGVRSVTEFLVYMKDYLDEAMNQVTRIADPQASALALHTIRKIAAMGVACMEQNGAPRRPDR